MTWSILTESTWATVISVLPSWSRNTCIPFAVLPALSLPPAWHIQFSKAILEAMCWRWDQPGDRSLRSGNTSWESAVLRSEILSFGLCMRKKSTYTEFESWFIWYVITAVAWLIMAPLWINPLKHTGCHATHVHIYTCHIYMCKYMHTLVHALIYLHMCIFNGYISRWRWLPALSISVS